ncbi:hypothetical protein EW146_g3097 [Bondarzewia mesenterica]|uniref:Uncharacterized protein n=1 Tax=Bondarzewia mesenterica TaxID=1095465 RepID=A0A4S4M059_9AGAM|nr:hypothetical protein EW146_g3097 [Bondarzewia mesenterica]
MRTSSALAAAAIAIHAVPAFANPIVGLPQDQVDRITKAIQALNNDDPSHHVQVLRNEGRSLAGTLLGDAAKAGETVVGDTAGDAAKKGILGGLGTLAGGGILDKLFGGDSNSSSKREFLESLQARTHDELVTRSLAGTLLGDVANAGEKVAGNSLGDAAKKGILGGLGTLAGGGILNAIFGGDASNSSSKREVLEYLQARAHDELAARSLAGTLLGDAAKVGEKVVGDTAGDAAKKGILGGLGTLAGGGILDKIFGDNSNDSSSKRELSEYLEARGLGSAAGKGLLGGLGTLFGGGLLSGLFGDDNSNSKRDILEFIQARVNQENAARQLKRELLSSLLETRSFNDLD